MKSVILSFLLVATLVAQGPGSGGPGGTGGSGGGSGGTTGGSGGGGGATGSGRVLTDETQLTTITGTVTAIDLYNHELEYPTITVDGVVIKVAPLWFLQENDFELNIGDTVQILALPCRFSTDASYYAVIIRILENGVVVAEIALRDSSGQPLWSGRTSQAGTPATGARKCAAQGGNCLVMFGSDDVTGIVDRVFPGPAIHQYRVRLRQQDGHFVDISLGPLRHMLAWDFELKVGETVTIRCGLLQRTRERLALQIGYGNGYRLTVRNEAGVPAWR